MASELALTSEEREFFTFLNQIIPNKEDKIGEIHKKFSCYQQIINKISYKINLINKVDLYKIWTRHFIDSLIHIKLFPDLFVSHETIGERIKAVDVGSGSGLPGIPIAIMQEYIDITLIESIRKKSILVDNILIRDLGITNVKVKNDRAEVLANDENYREKFDFSFARAVAKPPVSLELVLPLVKVGGKALFWASGEEWNQQNNLANISKILGGKISDEKSYRLPGEDRDRKIILVEKISQTKKEYPRKSGIPKKKPLQTSPLGDHIS